MKKEKNLLALVFTVTLVFISSSAGRAWDSKFGKEVEKEQEAVKLVREVQKGGYDLLTTEELKAMIDAQVRTC